MKYTYIPHGVCSKEIEIEEKDGIIKSLNVIGGCSGNLQGISKIVEGMEIENVIKKLKGIKCGGKDTSCPDQIALALEKILK